MSDIAAKIVDAIFDQWSVDGGLTKSKAVERVAEVLAAAKQQAKSKPTVKILPGERYPYERSMVDLRDRQIEQLISPYGVHPETQAGPVCGCATCTSFRNMQGQYRD